MDFIPILAMVENAVHVTQYVVRMGALRILGALGALVVLGALGALGVLGELSDK